MRNTYDDKDKRGSALILVVFTLFLVTLVVSAIFALSRQNFLGVNKDYHGNKAEYGAKAGIEHAIALLTNDPTVGTQAGGFELNDEPLDGEPDVTYSLHIITNGSPPPTIVTAPDGLAIPPRVAWVKSTGVLRDRANSSSSSLVKLVGLQRPILKQGLFGINFVEVSDNSTVQGYNFALSGAARKLDRRGDIGVNATTLFPNLLAPSPSPYPGVNRSGVVVDSSSSIKGQVRVGVGSPSIGTVAQIAPGTVVNNEDPTNATVISQEATQVPRFMLPSDPALSNYRFIHNLVTRDTAVAPPSPGPSASPMATSTPGGNTWRIGPWIASSPTPVPAFNIDNTTTPPAGAQLPDPDPATTGYNDLKVIAPGLYDLNDVGGELTLENVVLRAGARYEFRGNVTFKGNVNISNVRANGTSWDDPGTPEIESVPATCLYVDGDVKFEPGCKVNMDRLDEDSDGDSAEPIAPRRLQIYTSTGLGEDQSISSHNILVGDSTPSPKAEVSCVLVGSAMRVRLRNTDFYGGIQALEVMATNHTNIYFDVDLWGQPLEGLGQMAVLLNTVQVYSPPILPAAPAPAAPASGPATSPTYTTYTTGPGWCSPIIPLPQSVQCYY